MRHPAPIFLLAIAWGAFVLFQLQPMLAKPLLPALGGAPLVWQACMMVFQALLLAGYAHAFWLLKQPPRRQWTLHGLLWLAALASLLVPFTTVSYFDPARHPVLWLAARLLREIGLPFVALAATTPLMQAWALRHRPDLGRDSFRLYAASNFGSLAGLLSYPFLVEPWCSRSAQQGLLLGGLLLQAGLIFGAAWTARRAPPVTPIPGGARPSLRQQARWALYGGLGCCLMLGTTHHLAMDVASVPLLWVPPLALYLVSFMVAFGRAGAKLVTWRRYELPLAALALLVHLLPAPGLGMLPVLLGSMFLLCVVVHGWLAADAPAPQQAGRYYLMIALGGVAAGAFNGWLAPLLFDRVIEHAVAILAVMLAMAARGGETETPFPSAKAGWMLAAGVGGALLLGCLCAPALPWVRWTASGGFCALFLLLRYEMRAPLAAQIVPFLLLVLWVYTAPEENPLLLRTRSWFGVMAVTEDRAANTHILFHGTTLHGIQRRDPAHARDLLAYYAPLGVVWKQLTPALRARPFGVVGLGAGTLACLDGGPHAADLFEIDPAMVALARDPNYFSYLAECGAGDRIFLGDGRLSLTAIEPGRYGLLVLDAFSSDSVPLHLLSLEAVRLYRQKLAAGGVLAVHVSNRYLDLAPVLSTLAAAEGVPAWQWRFTPSAAERQAGIADSVWVFLGASPLPPVLPSGAERLRIDDAHLRWTDDFSALWRVVR